MLNITSANEPVPSDKQAGLQRSYEAALVLMKQKSSFFRNLPEAETKTEAFQPPIPYRPPALVVDGRVYLRVAADSLQVEMLWNTPLNKYLQLEGKNLQKIPQLSLTEAVEVGRKYLLDAGIETASPQLQLTEIDFSRSAWNLRWCRLADNYLWDDFVEPYRENILVSFHETLGLVGVTREIYSPPPKSLVVKLSRVSAIEKASRYVPLVQRTPYYQQARAPGFVVKGLKSCELRVAVPNWLLDPERAIWLREKPPEETRLCWVVRFTTVDTQQEEREKQAGKPFKLIPPDILIYLDAATGEVVGANFS